MDPLFLRRQESRKVDPLVRAWMTVILLKNAFLSILAMTAIVIASVARRSIYLNATYLMLHLIRIDPILDIKDDLGRCFWFRIVFISYAYHFQGISIKQCISHSFEKS